MTEDDLDTHADRLVPGSAGWCRPRPSRRRGNRRPAGGEARAPTRRLYRAAGSSRARGDLPPRRPRASRPGLLGQLSNCTGTLVAVASSGSGRSTHRDELPRQGAGGRGQGSGARTSSPSASRSVKVQTDAVVVAVKAMHDGTGQHVAVTGPTALRGRRAGTRPRSRRWNLPLRAPVRRHPQTGTARGSAPASIRETRELVRPGHFNQGGHISASHAGGEGEARAAGAVCWSR